MQPLGAEDPQSIGPYRLLGRLGAGGMGSVYVGRTSGGRTVAVKAVHPHFALDEQFRARFRREVSAARRVGGEWTAPVLDADPEARVPWVATGYVAGPPLGQAVLDTGPLPAAAVRALAAGLAEALAAVHRLGLVHRDVKPSNVLLTLDGPRLIDFGIARATEGTVSLTSTGASIGSPGYMSPEQILGRTVDGAADVFSLGAVLAYAATGAGPFPGDSSAALLYKVVHEEAVLAAGLTEDLRDLVAACLAKEPAARPTPEQIARHLAPGGAARLMGPGWLPGPLVEQVSRQAVALLDLEAAAPARPPVPGPARGPAPAPGPAAVDLTQPPGTARPLDPDLAPVLGSFGPPDPAYHSDPGGTGRPPHPGAVPPPAAGDPAARPGEESGGRRISLAASVGGRKRPRLLSCSLVLSVAGALAMATTALVVFRVLPGGDEGDKGSQKDSDPPAATGTPHPSSSVPADFTGSWEGDVRTTGGTPNGSMAATIGAGKPGEYVVRIRYEVKAGSLALHCYSEARLISADRERITALERPDTGREGDLGCTGAEAEVTFTRDGDGLLFTSEDTRGGKPSARLTRTDRD
ncbi:serine/threonine-protein kinase [Streptomyces sp. NPDC018031]|uniref:serine/threonine-protein kinase n=1 Tax=Streptomyces sp. NPDC018031 TaxID=3365033 RepID=UPI0037ADD36C